jgi:hypothetical protein
MTDQPENPLPEAPPAASAAPKKRMGWPKGKKRKLTPRIPAEPRVTAAPGREPIREVTSRASRVPLEQRRWDGEYDAGGSSADRLGIAQSDIPEGFDLTWVTNSVFGKPEPDRMRAFEKGGWEPVHSTDFQGKYRGRWTDKTNDGPIEFNGLTLCARPMEISKKSRARDQREAREAVMIKEQQLRGGEMKGLSQDAFQAQSALNSNKISRTLERVTVPDS